MGEEVTRNAGGLAEPPKRSTDTGTAGSAPGKQAGGNRPATAPGTGGTAPAGGSTGGKAGGKAEKEKTSGLASINPPPVPDSPKKKQRKPRQKKEDKSTTFNASQLSALIVSLSAIVASRPGLEMFVISEIEAQQIATPLANMIAKSEQLSQLSEHADALALVTATFVIMAPRMMMYFDAQKQRRLKAAGGVKLVRTDTQDAKSGRDSGKPGEHSSRNTADDVPSFFAAMPPIAD